MRLYRVNALLLKYYYITLNSFDRVFDIFYWPLLDVFIWGFMVIYIQKVSDLNLLNFIMAGIVMWVFVWRSSQDITVYILEDFWSRNMYHLFSSPMRVSELVLSVITLGFMRSIVTFAFLSMVAYLAFSFTVLTIPLASFAWFVVVLTLFSWALGLIISSLIMLFGPRIQVLAWSMVWIIQPFSCVFYPLAALPGWAQHIALALPTTSVFEALRLSLSGGHASGASMLYSLIASFALFIAAACIFGRCVSQSRKSGMLAKSE